MRSDAPDGAAITAAGDRRVTRMGARIRSSRLDELPQLYQVLTGSMALIGPRPEAPEWVTDRPEWDHVLAVRPAIAGLTQVVAGPWEARNLIGDDVEKIYREVALPAKLAIDLWYVQHASLKVDLIVLWSLLETYLLRRSSTMAHRLIIESVSDGSVLAADLLPTRVTDLKV